MSLRAVGGALLAAGNRLLAACCDICYPPDLWCNASKDPCGNTISSCGPLGQDTTGACTEVCVPPPDPCECGPETPCQLCYECVERKCVRIEDCCADGTPCPACQTCVNGVCQPCGDCEACEDGTCQPCGPCTECIDGVCEPCADLCIGGVCFPSQYYCCYDSPESTGGGPRTTSCRPARLTAVGQENPCQYGAKSGPHASSLLCQQACSRFKCVPDACGNNQCVPDPNGAYENYQACSQACGDPCNMPCSFAGANAPGIYSIDGCQREICVSYCSTNSRPIRVQIWGPIMVNGCPQPGTRVIKTDSDWRGEDCCDCPDDRGEGQLEGGPKGQITWNKPRGAISFEVAVLTACGAAYTIDIQACDPCAEQDDPEPCACEDDGDCNEGCHCCDGECQAEPCGGCDCDLSDGNWPPPEDTVDDTGSTLNTNVADNGAIQSDLNSLFSTNKIAWKAGYPGALDGCVTAWWFFAAEEPLIYCPDAAGLFCRTGYFSYRLLHATCPDGNVVDITATAVDEIVAGSLSRGDRCKDTGSGEDCPADCCDVSGGDWPPDPPEVIFGLPP